VAGNYKDEDKEREVNEGIEINIVSRRFVTV